MRQTMNPIDTSDGRFKDGNPATGEYGTVVTAEHLNNVQDSVISMQNEIITVLNEAGIAVNSNDNTQLWQALQVMLGQVESIEALREFEPLQDKQVAFVKGYYAGTIVGGGFFIADFSDTTSADNGGTVIVTAGGKRWKRVYQTLSLYDFGYNKSKDNASEALKNAEKHQKNEEIDCLNLTINWEDVGAFPDANLYFNGKVTYNNFAYSFKYNRPRLGGGNVILGDNAGGVARHRVSRRNSVVAIGNQAGRNLQDVYTSIAMGSRALFSAEKSRDNIAIGDDSLFFVNADSADYNQSKMNGTRNVGIGGNAGRGITSGFGNVAIGRNAGQNLSTGNGNVALGSEAFAGHVPVGFSGDIEHHFPSAAAHCVAVGTAALKGYVHQEPQTVVGSYAATSLKTALRCSAFGFGALRSLDRDISHNGREIIWVGTEQGTYQQNGRTITLSFNSHQLIEVGCVIGVRLLDGEAKTLQNDVVPSKVERIEGGSIIVYGGKDLNTEGRAELRFIYSNALKNNKNQDMTAIGYAALNACKNASYTTAVGSNALRFGDNHEKTIAIGVSALEKGDHSGSVAIGYYTAAGGLNTSDCIFLGDAAGFRWQNGEVAKGELNNSVAIGKSARVAGDNEIQIGFGKQTVFLSSHPQVRSDLRDKTDVQPLDLGLDFVKHLKPIAGFYDKRDDYVDELFLDHPEQERNRLLRKWWANPVKDGRHKGNKRHFWLGAQDLVELEKTFGELPMLEHQNQHGADTYSVAYEGFIPVLIKAIQELSRKVDSLESSKSDL